MRKSGHADLPLHTGTVPKWLADRMMTTGTLIIEALVMNYGRKEALVRLSDPLWFQSFGAVMGMDWHSSGITTSVMYALKRGLNPRARDLGICVCGGRGKYSRKTPEELQILASISNLDGDALIKASKLSAKVDNTAVQDGFQLYQHNFIVTCDGDWAVVQQGMNVEKRAARRYHWCSDNVRLFAEKDGFLDEPHTGVTGENKGDILNLTAADADKTRSAILTLSKEEPSRVLKECVAIFNSDGTQNTASLWNGSDSGEVADSKYARNAVLPAHHEVRKEDVNTKRLGAVLTTAYEKQPEDFSSLLLTEGLGPRTLQSLTLVSEVIYGTPSRFTDPARFSFAHGGKDGHPFPVPLKIYDESIRVLQDSIEKSKLGYNEKSECIRKLHSTALRIEQQCEPDADFDAVIKHERLHSKEWGGRTVGS
ncbi:MAG: DUF763 domain-containing protein [Treponemataceae bacterium]|nr:DUF763 domain-containing protein [Treponemataceae bacterium]